MKRENIPFKDLEKNNFLRFVFSSQFFKVFYIQKRSLFLPIYGLNTALANFQSRKKR